MTNGIRLDTIKDVKVIKSTPQFNKWLNGLRDPRARAKVNVRLRRLQTGAYGDCEPVGEGISELRIFYGPGYRVYFIERFGEFVLLLAGGNKSTQDKDIKLAKKLANNFEG